jgi:tetratricopeptide (TPR) repeat protein
MGQRKRLRERLICIFILFMEVRPAFVALVLLLAVLSAYGRPADSLLLALRTHPQKDNVRVNLLNELCKEYRNTKADSARLFGSSALELARDLGFKWGEATAYNLLGSVSFYEGNYKKADSLQDLAIQCSIKNNIPSALATAYNSAGLSKQYQDNYVDAVNFFIKALQLEDKARNVVGQVKVIANLGAVYRKLGAGRQSIAYYLRADSLNRTLPRKTKILGALATNIGNYYAYVNQYDEALNYYLQSLEENKLSGNRSNIALSNNNIGFCYLQMKKPLQASLFIENALKALENNNLGNLKSLILLNVGTLRLQQNRPREAIRFANEALVIARTKKEKDRELTCYRGLAEAYQYLHTHDRANYYLLQAYQLNDSLRNIEITTAIGNIQKSYELTKKQNEIDLLSQEAKIKSLELERERNINYLLYFGIFVLISISGLIGYNVYTKTQLNKKLHQQNQNIESQKKIIEAINLSLEEKASRAQMNPHFIFNSLNSIQYLIVNKNNDDAFQYLVSFASLLRGIFDFSDRQVISLKEEIELLTHYLQLEALRFDDNFSYALFFEDVETSAIRVPPLILQPFVENAIVHGLLQQKNDRAIAISFAQTDRVIHCTITDNGIGRAAASKNKSQQKNKTSRGIDVTRDRLIVFNQNSEEPVLIKDLVDEQGEPSGTSVTLTIRHVH